MIRSAFLACTFSGLAFLGASLLPLPVQADPYVWDNQNGNGIWNDPVNWGVLNNPGANISPTAADSAIFRSGSPAGTVVLTNDGFAQKLRQNVSAPARTISIGPAETVDRRLTLSGTAAELIECLLATADLTLEGTPNANGAGLKLVINGNQSACPVNGGKSLVLNCDVSGTNGISLNPGDSGTGRLILGGVSTYTGPTTVNAGTLLVNGSLGAASAVTVNSGGTLGGSGTIGGSVAVNAGATLSPGASLGSLAVGGNLSIGGNLFIDLDKSLSPSNDMVTVSGVLTNAGTGSVTLRNLGAVPLATGDSFKIFNKPLLNGGALHLVPLGSEVWTNRLALDGTVAVLSSTNVPVSGDPTTAFTWTGNALTDQNWSNGGNWVGGVAPPPLSSNIIVFQGDIRVPYNWPYIDTNYGTTILIFSNNIVLNGIKILAGIGHTMNLGSYVLQLQPPDAQSPCYFGIDSPIAITWQGHSNWVVSANFTNALGDASVGGQTEFKCIGGRLDVYGVLKDGLGAHSRLVKSGDRTLNITGMHANTYTGGTVVNAGPIKLQKPAGVNAIPGDVTVNGTGGLIINIGGGEQIADTAIVTFNDSAYFDLIGQPETVQTIQSLSSNTRIYNVDSTLTVAPSLSGTYNGGVGESDFAGSISGSGDVRMNGTGTYGMLGANSVASLTINSGTLKVNGNTGTGPVTVNTGGTLLGAGAIAGPVTVASGGTIGAGFSAGLLTLASGLDLSADSSGATNVWELAALKDNATGVAGTDFDRIVLTGGTLMLGEQSTLDIRFAGSASAPIPSVPFWQSAHTWTVIQNSGGSNPGLTSFGRVENGSYAAGSFTTAAAGSGSIVLTFTPSAVPPVTPPRITSITNASPGAVTVSYTNTLPGTNYTLVYTTNLPNSTNWYPASTRTATGASDAQTDNSATNNQRYYRVYYP
jgi:autotransporter-associated beta strand protein